MNKILVPGIIAFLISIGACKNARDNQSTADSTKEFLNKAESAEAGKLNTGWKENFVQFRTALYNNDTIWLKQFFEFPLKDIDGNEIAEKGFGTFIKNNFSTAFKTALMKINADDLYKTNEALTDTLHRTENPYQLLVTATDNELTLNLAIYNSPDANGAYISEGESNFIYVFKITAEKTLRFKSILLAG